MRYQPKIPKAFKEKSSTIQLKGYAGLNISTGYRLLSAFSHFRYNNHYYVYLHPTFIIDKNQTKYHYEGNFQPLYNEESFSGLGFENDWVVLQIGKGNESWGAGTVQLALSERSSLYDYLLIGSDYGKVRVRYIHGFLETVSKDNNRFITARGFEWTNQKSLIIGFSETVIYSGENRMMDIGYFNPISSHLEIELNNRLNEIGSMGSNGVWQIHFDYLFANSVRFSLNYLFDEFVLDKNIEIGKEHGKAHSARLAYTPFHSSNHLITGYISFVHIGTPTFRHFYGTNNFVHKSKPLGWHKGSDSQEIAFGINYFNYKDLIIKTSVGVLKSGEQTINDNVLEPIEMQDYIKGEFPSGQVTKTYFIESEFIYSWGKNYSISTILQHLNKSNNFYIKLNIPIIK
tara:strand:+ start:6976 stop:8178 length:1203 start_codon:yes stop_codon:yes gene_type:complete